MPDTDEKFYAGHRERLRAKLLDGKLTDNEKLELLLAYAIPRRDVRPLARSLVQRFGGVYKVFNASVDELVACKGIGHNTAVFIKLVKEIMTVNYKGQMKDMPVFHDEKILHNYCRMVLANKRVEELHLLYLDHNLQLISDETHSTGTFNTSLVYPREIARRALELNARSVVMVHNHPMSDHAFSQDDLDSTQLVISVLKSLEIEFYDLILVAGEKVFSMRTYYPFIKG